MQALCFADIWAEERRAVGGERQAGNRWPVCAHKGGDHILNRFVQVRPVIDDCDVLALQPLEVLRVGKRDLGKAVGMRDHVHAYGSPAEVRAAE